MLRPLHPLDAVIHVRWPAWRRPSQLFNFSAAHQPGSSHLDATPDAAVLGLQGTIIARDIEKYGDIAYVGKA